MNPYTHLRTLIDDGTPEEISAKIYCVATRKEPLENWGDFLGDTPNYTTSLDALIPLWPGDFSWSLEKTVSGYRANAAGEHSYFPFRERKTPALAMLDCLLQVLEYEHDRKETE